MGKSENFSSKISEVFLYQLMCVLCVCLSKYKPFLCQSVVSHLSRTEALKLGLYFTFQFMELQSIYAELGYNLGKRAIRYMWG